MEKFKTGMRSGRVAMGSQSLVRMKKAKKEAVPENRHGWSLYYPIQPFNYLAIDNFNQQKLITSDYYVFKLSDRCNG
ncbi:MAG: hypothetical protein LR011_10230 [Verrucomicrobia bacterium]|nr:hypothetical protein [Verrucomicrobiota bacterium]